MFRRPRVLVLLLSVCVSIPACHRPRPVEHRPALQPAFVTELAPPDVLIVVETEGPGGSALAESARALKLLLGHFEERCAVISADDYGDGQLQRYSHALYLAGQRDATARARFASDAADHDGTVVWVGDGVEALGGEIMGALGLRGQPGEQAVGDIKDWTISYGAQRHVEKLSVPALGAESTAPVLAEATRGAVGRPFIAGKDRVWYAAAGPRLVRERFWTTAIWADALHEMMRRPHGGQSRRLVPVLRDVPVWARRQQVPRAVKPMLSAGVPVAVLAWTKWGDVPLADRPEAVAGLRQAESMGAVVALVSQAGVDAGEHFRLGWEVGIHPVAWAGPTEGANPFRLRIGGSGGSPPLCAGGVLPAPIAMSDAGHIEADDAERLAMQEVVRDAVALVSFGLWASPTPFQSLLGNLRARGWEVADLRDLGVRVEDPRRMLVSGEASVGVTPRVRLRKVTFGPTWQIAAKETVSNSGPDAADLRVDPPERSVAVLEVAAARPPREFVKGVTLDPWAYTGESLSSRSLAEALAERYALNGMNTVFFYAYNVDEGAAYRTRYRGASMSRWGKSDLLAHILEACHARGIRVVAWLYSGRDKGMWNKHPEWRERTRTGRPHNPLRLHAAYFLCPRNPDVRKWYAGLLRDLARRYPTLDGIELCEPVVNWFGDQACYCDACREEFARKHPGERLAGPVWRGFRSEGLTEFLSGCLQPVAEQGIETYVMTISDAWSNGAILSPRRQAEESGFDLDALLDGPCPPDWINFEIIWQQWAAIYGTEVFNYDWAAETARRLVRRTDGRARVMLHVELTDFGAQRMTPRRIAETVRNLKVAEADGVECYHSAAIDQKAAWPALTQAYGQLP